NAEECPSVCMRDPQRVEEIIKAMQKAGTSTIQVISDFDMTLTRFDYNGKRCPPSHNILNNSRLISEECKAQLKDLLNTYHPIEIDSKQTAEEKLPLMVEWWTKAHTLLVQQRIRKDLLQDMVKESDAMLKEGYQLFFDHLQEHSIPLLIFSAGLGDVLEEVFSNSMDFDETGVLKAFKGELIHIYNKREGGALLNTGHFQELKSRHNILLVGDSLGDLTMADGVHSMENILQIGFLNDKVEERKTSYLNAYDIVLVKDETMEVPNALLLCFGVALPRTSS
uniref:5'-nucleotidase n=1 Tax=Oncorhynchus tshawytscha TaxID=74940 RepID=A0A8C8HCK2_ONCTS